MSIPPSPLRPDDQGQRPLQTQQASGMPRPPPPPRTESTQSTEKTADPRKRPRASTEDTESSIEDANRLINRLRIDENAPDRNPATSPSMQPPPSRKTTVDNVNIPVHKRAQPLSPAALARPPTGPRALTAIALNPPSGRSKPPAPKPKSEESRNAESPSGSLTSAKDPSWLPPPLPSPPNPSRAVTTEQAMDQVPPSPSMSDAAPFAPESRIWHERIVCLSTAITAHQKWKIIKENLLRYDKMMNSSFSQDLGNDQRSHFRNEIAHLQEASTNEKKVYSGALLKLYKSGLWQLDVEWKPPVVPPPPKIHEEVLSQIVGIRAAMLELHGSVRALGSRLNVSVHPLHLQSEGVSSASTTNAPPDAVVVDADSRPVKRRRLSSLGGDAEMKERSLPPESRDVMSFKDIQTLAESLQTQVQSLENRLGEESDQAVTTINKEVEAKMEELKGQVNAHIDERVKKEKEDRDQKIEGLEKEMNRTGTDIEDMANEVAELIQQLEPITSENQVLKAENSQLKSENEQLQAEIEYLKKKIDSAQETHKQQVEVMEQEISQLDTKLTSFVTRPPPSPAFPESMNSLVRELKPLMIQAMREEMEPMLFEVRAVVEEMLKRQNMELASSVVAKLSMTLQMLETLSSWAHQIKPDPEGSTRHRTMTS